MSFLIDKALLGAKKVANLGKHELTAVEKARESRYVESSKKYKRIVLKWLYVDKVPIDELKRLGLWKPTLLSANLQSQGGGSGIPGTPLVPILTPSMQSPVHPYRRGGKDDRRSR